MNYDLTVKEERVGHNKYRFLPLNIKSFPENSQFAWYVIKDNEQIFTQWYEEKGYLEYDFTQSGTYQIIMFVQTDKGQTIGSDYSKKINID